MAATIYGATVVQEKGNESDLRYDVVGTNSEVFVENEIVTVSSGLMTAQATTATVLGVVVKSQTMASDNQTVGFVKPAYIPADGTIFLMGADSDLSVTAGPGTYYGLKGTGASGTQQIDVTSGVTTGANRVVEIVKVDPFNEGGTGSGSGLRQAYVRFVKTPYTNVTITA